MDFGGTVASGGGIAAVGAEMIIGLRGVTMGAGSPPGLIRIILGEGCEQPSRDGRRGGDAPFGVWKSDGAGVRERGIAFAVFTVSVDPRLVLVFGAVPAALDSTGRVGEDLIGDCACPPPKP